MRCVLGQECAEAVISLKLGKVQYYWREELERKQESFAERNTCVARACRLLKIFGGWQSIIRWICDCKGTRRFAVQVLEMPLRLGIEHGQMTESQVPANKHFS